MPRTATGISTRDALALADVLQHLAEASDTPDLARRTCAQVRRLLRADGVCFALNEGAEVYFAEEDATERLWKGRRYPAAACVSGWAIAHRCAATIEDVRVDPRVPKEVTRAGFVHSLAVLPLGWNEPLGALGAYWTLRHRPSARDMFLLERAAQAAYVALRGCRARAAVELDAGRGLQVLAMIAHDLRTPLTAVMNTTQALARTLPGTQADQQRAVARIQRSAEHAVYLVNHLMHYARLQCANMPLTLQSARLDETCAAAVEEVRAAHPARRIRVEAEPAVGLWDAPRLGDAISNLILNAVEHGDPQGEVRVRVRTTGEECRVEVHNEGPPIPPACIPHLFEAFRREHSTGGSLGLGLYICDQVVRAHGGHIEVESSREAGTLFRVRLPRQANVLAASAPPAQQAG